MVSEGRPLSSGPVAAGEQRAPIRPAISLSASGRNRHSWFGPGGLISGVRMTEKVVVFTGAGVSAESGLKTFRDMGGLWNEYAIEDVASPEGWKRNPSAVLSFYNERRQAVLAAKPNDAHKAIASWKRSSMSS